MATKRPKARTGRGKSPKTNENLPKSPLAKAYLKKLSVEVRRHFTKAVDLHTFLKTAKMLTTAQRIQIVRQALILIDQNYVHQYPNNESKLCLMCHFPPTFKGRHKTQDPRHKISKSYVLSLVS